MLRENRRGRTSHDAFPGLILLTPQTGEETGACLGCHPGWSGNQRLLLERLRIQDGFSHFFPPEVMGTHIGPAWSHTSGRGLHTGLRALAASVGHMGIEADLTRMS